MPSTGYRGVDYLLFGYFLIQIPTTLLFDTQGVYPEWLYPSFLRSLRHHYLETYKDPFLADPWKHPWYLSLCFMEHYLGMPFYVWATYCYYHGAVNKPTIIIPAIIYSTHTITAVIAIWVTTMMADFSQLSEPAPNSFGERLVSCSAYMPFFIVPMDADHENGMHCVVFDSNLCGTSDFNRRALSYTTAGEGQRVANYLFNYAPAGNNGRTVAVGGDHEFNIATL